MKKPSKMEYILTEFRIRNIFLSDLTKLVLKGQKDYIPDLTKMEVNNAILGFLNKREVQHSLLTALAIDNLAMENKLPEPFQSIIEEDSPWYGVDETIALETAGLGGSIATSNFGLLDKIKPGIIGKMNDSQKNGKFITTMLDDQLSAIVAACEGKLAHNMRNN